MPAPKTRTISSAELMLVMVKSKIWVSAYTAPIDMTAATPTAVSGTSHSSGLRYVRISRSATTRAVASNNFASTASKTSSMSVPIADGPVT